MKGIFRIEGNKVEVAEIVKGFTQSNLWIPDIPSKRNPSKDDMWKDKAQPKEEKKKKVHFHFFSKRNKDPDMKKPKKRTHSVDLVSIFLTTF